MRRSALLSLAAVAVAVSKFSDQLGVTSTQRAESRDISRDGCRTEADNRYRREMLRNIAQGFERGAVLTQERAWKA